MQLGLDAVLRAEAARMGADAAGIAGGLALPVLKPTLPAGFGSASEVNFADVMWQAVRGVDDQSRIAGERAEAVDSGASDDLVGAMLSSQEASLSFSMLMQVRNKVVGAVDELIKLQL